VLRVGPYVVERRLATGGMAEVLLARAPDGGLVALKRVLPHLAGLHAVVRRFVDEARTLVELDDPHVVRLVDCFVDGDVLVLALEHIDGVDLRTLLARARERGVPIPPAATAAVREAVAAALAGLHARGLVHRDVKASNVLVAWDGTVKLADLGIAAPGSSGVDERALSALVRRLGGAAPEEAPSRDALVELLDALFPVEERARLEAAAGDPTRVLYRLGMGALAFAASLLLAFAAVAWLRPAPSR
jgi:serine/threonine-protein kinase